MAKPKVYEGTVEEITEMLTSGRIRGRNAKLLVDEDCVSPDAVVPGPSSTIKDFARLEAMLREGFSTNPTTPMTAEDSETESRRTSSRVLPDPPNTVHSVDEIESLLLAALDGEPGTPMTQQDWEYVCRKVVERHRQRVNATPRDA